MPVSRWVVSLFVVWYLTALVLSALPQPAGVQGPLAPSRPHNRLSGIVAPVLDSAAATLAPAFRILWTTTWPVRPLTADALQRVGLAQRWDMFADPSHQDDYLRVRYYVVAAQARAANPSWTATELIFPSHREDRVRTLASFRTFHLDRTMMSALDRFHVDRSQPIPPDAPRAVEFETALRPSVRYFARRFQATRLSAGEQIVRIEVWHGAATDAGAISSPQTDGSRAARLDALRRYYSGPVEDTLLTAAYPPYLSVEREADLAWTLEYIEQW